MSREDFHNYPGYRGPNEGGTSMSVSNETGVFKAFTKFGEMVCELNDQGGLIANFWENGLIFQYSDEGKLELCFVNIGDYLDSYIDKLSDEEIDDLPNQGENIYGLLEYLDDENLDIVAKMDLQNGVFQVLSCEKGNFRVVSYNGDVEPGIVSEDIDVDFETGKIGGWKINGNEIVYEFTDVGDDMFLSLGEYHEGRSRLCSVEISHNVNYEDAVLGDDPKRFQKLASKIILN